MNDIVRIYLVDTSGSMDGFKKNSVCSAVESDPKIDHLFAFGTSIRAEVKPSELRSFPFDDGTSIQKCLFDMFSRLQQMTGSKKDFVFITDALDTLSDVEGIKRAWQQCQDYHKNQNGFITVRTTFIDEGSGGCVKELQQVFKSVHVVGPNDLTDFMKKAQKAHEIMTTYQKDLAVIDTSIASIDLKTAEAEKLLSEAETNVADISKELTSFEEGAKQLQDDINGINEIIKKMEIQGNQTKLRKEFEEAKMELFKLESIQDEALENAAMLLSKIEKKNLELLKIKDDLVKEQQNIDKAEQSSTDAVSEVDILHKKIADLRSKLAGSNAMAIEDIAKEIQKLSGEILKKTQAATDQFKKASALQKALTKEKVKVKDNKASLDEKKKIVNGMFDQILTFAAN